MCAHKRVEIRLLFINEFNHENAAPFGRVPFSMSTHTRTHSNSHNTHSHSTHSTRTPPQTTLLTALIQSLHIHEPSTGLLV